FVPADPRRKEEALARYGSTEGELAIQPSEDILAAAAPWFEKAKRVLVTDGYHLPLVLLVMPVGRETLHFLDVPDRQAIYVTMRQIANEGERSGAVGVIHVAEFWMAPVDSVLQSGRRAGDLADRREGLAVTVATAGGRQRVHMVEFSKDEHG